MDFERMGFDAFLMMVWVSTDGVLFLIPFFDWIMITSKNSSFLGISDDNI